MIWPDAIPIAIETVRSRDYLSEDQKRGILFENAVRFLGLTDAERAGSSNERAVEGHSSPFFPVQLKALEGSEG